MPFPPDDQLLDPSDAATRAFLTGVQANILKPHGRDFARLLLFRATVGPEAFGADFWREVADRVTTAEGQERQARNRHINPRSVVRTVAISAAGAHALGVADERPGDAAGYGRALVSENDPSDRFGPFNLGMRESFRVSGEPMNHELAGWEAPYRDGVHVLWTVACACVETLAHVCAELVAWNAARGLALVAEERCAAWRNAAGCAREPFGFVDGVSVPAFFAGERTKENLGGRWATMRLSDVLIAPGMSERHAGGSMLVVRKLEQNVRAFHAFAREMEPILRKAGMDDVPASELLVGRCLTGEPLPGVPARRTPGVNRLNDFDFDDDPRGEACPFHAHIRKMNPRVDYPAEGGSARVGDQLRAVQIVRRGMPYDPTGRLMAKERGEIAEWPEGGVGLMFLAYAHTLEAFETMQNNWAHHPRFPHAAGADPLLAGAGAHWEWRGVRSPAPLARFVTARGGEYFYAPSLNRLRNWPR